jgi:RimJ/RimL family protein N-acetyltransferase
MAVQQNGHTPDRREDVTVIRLMPFSRERARMVMESERQEDWAAGYPTAGDVEVAGRIVDGTWQPTSESDPWGAWVVFESDSGLVVGGAGFHGTPDVEGSVEIGYGIAPEWHGRGIATSAVGMLIDMAASLGARCIVAGTDEDNVASQRVLEKCGFTQATPIDGEMRWQLDVLTESPA